MQETAGDRTPMPTLISASSTNQGGSGELDARVPWKTPPPASYHRQS
jgi:hypothetical protein